MGARTDAFQEQSLDQLVDRKVMYGYREPNRRQ
jgi:hypothetical protein